MKTWCFVVRRCVAPRPPCWVGALGGWVWSLLYGKPGDAIWGWWTFFFREIDWFFAGSCVILLHKPKKIYFFRLVLQEGGQDWLTGFQQVKKVFPTFDTALSTSTPLGRHPGPNKSLQPAPQPSTLTYCLDGTSRADTAPSPPPPPSPSTA